MRHDMPLPAPLAPLTKAAAESAAAGLCEVAGALAAQGWCQGTGGNLSGTLEASPLRLLITRSGVHKRHLTPADLMVVGEGGRAIEGTSGDSVKPSAEVALHAVIAAATGAGAVLHVHSVPATLLGEHFQERGGLTLRG